MEGHAVVSAAPVARVPCPCCGGRQATFARRVSGFSLERCAACGLVFVNPRPTERALTDLYRAKAADRQADFYARTVSAAQKFEYTRILADIRTLLGSGGRLLDLGCAAGYFMEEAVRAGFEAHGTDLATWVERIAAERGVANVHAGRLTDVNFGAGSFDVVHSSQVFEHLPNPLEELAEIRRVLRPGGILYVNVPNYQCLSIVLGRDDFELNMPPEHVAYFTPRTLARLLSSAGFEVVRTSSYGGLKWENLLGRPIRSEIAEAVRVGARPPGASRVDDPPRRVRAGGRLARDFFYRVLKVGMTLEAFARRPLRRDTP